MTGPLENEILAVTLDEAVCILEMAKVPFEIIHTGPPRCRGGGMGKERVLRFQAGERTVIITVAREMVKSAD